MKARRVLVVGDPEQEATRARIIQALAEAATMNQTVSERTIAETMQQIRNLPPKNSHTRLPIGCQWVAHDGARARARRIRQMIRQGAITPEALQALLGRMKEALQAPEPEPAR